MKKIAISLLIIAAPAAQAAVTYKPIQQCWTPPTERESGEALPLSEIRGYAITHKITGSTTTFAPLGAEVASPTTCVTYTPTLANEVCFSGKTIDTDGLASANAEPVCKLPVKIPSRPKPHKWK